MPYHPSNFKRFLLVVILGGCFLWNKKDSFGGMLCNNSASPGALVEFGPVPMLHDVPMMPDFSPTEEVLLPKQQELIEQKLQLRDNLLRDLMEKRNHLKID